MRAGDVDAFRQAVRLSCTLWGGRFNPIIVVDREEEAARLVDVFRIDAILPIGNSEAVTEFPKRFPHLISPFINDALFVGGMGERKHARLLDIYNMLVHFRHRPEWKEVRDAGVRVFTWEPDDPLSDVFLSQFGSYPTPEEIGIDYGDMLVEMAGAEEYALPRSLPIPTIASDYASIASMSRFGLERHYDFRGGVGGAGFFVGDATDVDDLVCHWNLRASDITLLFIDPSHLDRYENIIPAYAKMLQEDVASNREPDWRLAVWSRRENMDEICRPFGGLPLIICRISITTWNGLNVLPPMMRLGEVSTLGVVGREGDKTKVSFSLDEKPFSDHPYFGFQRLVASVSFVGGIGGDQQLTLHPPYVPELNEFYSRTMHFIYYRLRIEPERVGIVIGTTDADSYLHALLVADLMDRIFGMGGFTSKLSSGGLVAQQLITQLGGLQGARAFKIPGVRRLLKGHGPRESFTQNKAKQMIESKDLSDAHARFNKDHQELYIESRSHGTPLTSDAVFSYLVEKGLFRIGAELTCPRCRIPDWTSLDALK